MPKDDSDRVFDVSKPNKASPDPTSRPIIVGHHPMMNDPMVKEDKETKEDHEFTAPTQHKSIPIHTPDEPVHNPQPEDVSPTLVPAMVQHPESVKAAVAPPVLNEAPAPTNQSPSDDLHLASLDDLIGHEHKPFEQHDEVGHHDHHHHEEPAQDTPATVTHQQTRAPHSSNKMTRALLVLLLIIIAGYLLIDARVIKTSIDLPFHIFKQPAPAASVAAPVATSTVTPSTTSPLAGQAVYKLADTGVSFDYPTTWGAPAVTSDPGYTTRSSAAKSAGTYAYLVNFATNKDVQIAFTSGKYLPAGRTALYYDYLQWCIGTNDGKFYKSILHFATTGGVDTPSTISCDQGPLNDAAKVDAKTLVQLKTNNPDGSALGDLYTKNLTGTDLPVMRVKDAAMTNSTAIKKLLTSVKQSATPGT